MNYLVLGGNGFIGSHFVDLLLKKGHSVRVFDKGRERYRSENPKVEYIYSSFDSLPDLNEALQNVDIVIHLISTTSPVTSNKAHPEDIKSNLINTVKFLDLMIQKNIKRILFFSSGGTVYGEPKYLPVDENHPTNPISSYGIVKLSIEKYLFLYQKNYNLEPLIIRASNPYGIRQSHIGVQGLISTLLMKALQKKEIQIYGDGTIVRDFIYIDDLVEISYQGLINNLQGIYNLGSGKGCSIIQLINLIQDISKIKLILNYQEARKFDVQNIVLDSNKLFNCLSNPQIIEIESGLIKHLEWLKNIVNNED